MSKTTLVTGIWDLDRSSLGDGWNRGFDHYISNFISLLNATKDTDLIVFIDPKHEYIVWDHRSKHNTRVYHHSKSDFGGNFFPFFDKIQEIRQNKEWLETAGWLKDSTQARLEYYNPMVMSKMFLLHNASIFNPFNSEYFYWIDGGITNTVHPGYFSHDNVINKIEEITNKFLFVCFPYESESDIHGFKMDGMNRFSNSENKVNRVARGGFFGGKHEYISQANNLYYSLLNDTLSSGYMGTEESIFTIMTYLDSQIYQYEEIEDNGLLVTFFENVKNDNTKLTKQKKQKLYKNNNIILYINAFNSPEQLQMVIDSFEQYDPNFLTKTRKILLNNTTKENLFDDYEKISKKYDIEEIRHGNKGICRSRQIAAEHFKESESKYMMFFEDDMLLDLSDNLCQFGLRKNIKNLYKNVLDIIDSEDYDFLKFCFSEFYGHNGEQWTWHNVPEERRIEYFGKINKRPPTKFSHIKSYNGVPYADGEIYYSNWPHIIGQVGNQKLFLDTKWDNPFEQTWMSHTYTLTKTNKVRPAILLASPITHNRVHFYEASERKEN
jgi:hypothetical protein